jgi:type I restriction enzyme M protein
VRDEHEEQGFDGRFGPGLPRVSDGSLLFLLHLAQQDASREDGGSRFGIVLNGSPLFTGGAGSGESEIRRHLLENDLVEAIVGLPDRHVLQHRHRHLRVDRRPTASPPTRKGKVQLIDACELLRRRCARASAASARSSPTRTSTTSRALFGNFEKSTRDGAPISRIFKNEDFGYRTITVERPERDAKGQVVLATEGQGQGQARSPTPRLRDTENVPLSEDVERLLRHARCCLTPPDAWIDDDKTKVGYEIPFNRHFYVFKPPRPSCGDRRRLEGRDGRDPRHARGTLEVISGSDRTANAGRLPSV